MKRKLTRPKQHESTHTHSTDAETLKLLHAGKRSMHLEETTLLVHRMIEAGNSVAEIRKTLGGKDGVSNLSYDIRNWIDKFKYKVPPGFESVCEGRDLLNSIEKCGYYTAYQQAQEGGNIKSVFFMHPNIQEEPLISVQSVSHLGCSSIMTTPIAYAFVSNETTETYMWFLQSLQKFMKLRKDAIFVTDKCQSLVASLERGFPSSTAILCTWHMKENFKSELKGVFKSKEDAAICMDAVKRMINSSTKEEFEYAHDLYKLTATEPKNMKVVVKNKNGKNDEETPVFKTYEYFVNNWLPIKHKWAGYLVNRVDHFGCRTTQRVEGSHSTLKSSGYLTTRVPILNALNGVDEKAAGSTKKSPISKKASR